MKYRKIFPVMVKSIHALVALGANLPFEGEAPEMTLQRALKAVAKEGLSVLAVSRFYATPCFPAGAGPDYVNAAAVLDAGPESDATSIMARLHKVESDFGRRRDTRWGISCWDPG